MPVEIKREHAPIKKIVLRSDTSSSNYIEVTPNQKGGFQFNVPHFSPYVLESSLREFARALLEMLDDE